jgi:hypothetical protein
MADTRTLEVIINGKNNLSGTLDDAGKGLSSFQGSIAKSVDASKQFAAGFAVAGAAAVAFGVSSVNAANESEIAQKRLETLLLNVKGATLEQADALRELSVEQMKKTTLDDDAIIAGQSQLATFQLQASTIATLTPAMTDLGVAVNGVSVSQDQMQQVANLMGKAMEGNVGALTRYGVSMTDAEQETIKMGTEQQKAAVMVAVLQKNFGGLAEGMKKTTSGQIEATRVAFGNLQEKIGGALQPAINGLMGAFQKLIDKLMSYDWNQITVMFEKYRVPILVVAGAIAGPLVLAFGSAAVSAGAFVLSIAPVMLAGAALTALVLTIRTAWDQNWGGIQEKTKAVIAFLEPAFNNLKVVFEAAWEGIKVVILTVLPAIKTTITNGFNAVSSTIETIWNAMSGIVKTAWNAIEGVISVGINLFKGNWKAAWEGIKQTVVDVWNGIKAVITGVIDGLTKKWDEFVKKAGDFAAKLPGVGVSDAVGGFFDLRNYMGGATKKAMGGMVTGFGAQDTVPALLTPGEEVLRRNDPRNARNGGGGGLTVNVNGTFYGADRNFAKQIGDLLVARINQQVRYAR